MEFFGSDIGLRLFLLLVPSVYLRADFVHGNDLVVNQNSKSIRSIRSPPFYSNNYSYGNEEQLPTGGNFNSELTHNWISTVDNKTLVLRLEVTDDDISPPKVAVFSKSMLLMFYECLCDVTSITCCVEMDDTSNVTSVSPVHVVTHMNPLLSFFLCNQEDISKINCFRLKDLPTVVPALQFYCGVDQIIVKWVPSQNLNAKCLNSGITLIGSWFPGTGCDNHNNSGLEFPKDHVDTTTEWKVDNSSDINRTDDDDGIPSDALIGILVTCVIIIIVVVIFVALFVVKQRRKSKATNRSTRSSNSVSKISRGHFVDVKKRNNGNTQLSGKRKLDSKSSSSTTTTSGRRSLGTRPSTTTTSGHTMYDSYKTQDSSSSLDGRSNNSPSTIDDHVYATIDGAVGIRNDYASLDESIKYGHLYKGLFPSNPKLRPLMPLPPHITNQPQPYYSLAHPSTGDSANQNYLTADSSNQNSETVSTQYLELFDENSISNQPIGSADYVVPASIFSLTNDNVLDSSSYVSLYSTNDIPQYNQPEHSVRTWQL